MTVTDHSSAAPAAQPSGPAARALELVKTYGKGATVVRALDGVTTEFAHAEFTAIMGPSGSGKSTLMHCMAGLDVPTSGHVFIGDDPIDSLDDAGLTKLRRDRLGFVFQSFNLVPTLTAAENITLPADLAGHKVDPDWFNFLVDQLGHPGPAQPPADGALGRPAAARGRAPAPSIGRPDLIFADEPTGNLDSKASGEMLAFLRRSVTEFGQTIVMVTHDPRGAAYADRVVFLADGKVVGHISSPTVDTILEQMKQLGS